MSNKNRFFVIVAVAVIMAGAFAIRYYHFQDWLYFKMDQSRDANVISNAVKNGWVNLPLLGPRAGATQVSKGFLRLGPAYYYFQYLSGKIFNSTEPNVFAYPDLFFSIIILPMLYLFLRLYFARRHALMILAMYAFSFLVIQYSRFAWNPNALPFFIMLSFYGLLRFLNDERVKMKVRWIALWAIGMAIGSQLHFFGFFSLVGISGLLILVHYRVWEKTELQKLFTKNALKRFAVYAGAVVLFFGLIYTPVIISESMRGAQNSKNFIEALSTKAEKRPILEKISKDVSENLKYYCLVTTSECFDLSTSVKKNIWPIGLSTLIMLAGLSLAVMELRKKPTGMQKDFLWLLLLWFGVYTILTIPVAFQLRPRFYIVVFASPFISLGLIYKFLEEKYGRKLIVVSFLMTAVILGLNARGTYAWFKEQAKSQKSAFAIKRTLILKAKDGVTLGQLQGVVNFMSAHHKDGARLYYYVKPEHTSPIGYLLSENNSALVHSPMKVNDDPQAEYFAVTPAKSGLKPLTDKYGANIFTVTASEQYGQLMVYALEIPNRTISPSFKFKSENKNTDRVFWKDILGLKTKSTSNVDLSE